MNDRDICIAKWEAGQTTRWHVHPTIHNQTVADHTYGVLQCLSYIVPSNQLHQRVMLAALNHDIAELYTGDVPFTTKKIYPEIAKAVKVVEEDIHKELKACHKLFRHEQCWLRFADLAEMGLYALKERRLGNMFMDSVLGNVIEELIKIFDELCDMGQSSEQMHDMIMTLKKERAKHGQNPFESE